MSAPSRPAPTLAWRDGEAWRGAREVAEETPVALVYDASTYAVMMATPADIEDFAVGFSLTEGVIEDASQISALEVAESELGIEARIWLDPAVAARLSARRRRIVGPTGCGLCGVESLEAALTPRAAVAEPAFRLSAAQILAAGASLAEAQPLNAATRAVHAAGFMGPDGRLAAVREDVGRHNALDKLVGALARQGLGGREGAVVLTSRVSVEMVQKTAALGAAYLIAVSAPTALALRAAEAVGITVVGVARGDGFEVFTHAGRVVMDAAAKARP
ncbi:MAG: formate dehydrogenase accessory sulfurtransferase FdhD [Caulobacteraceae bacterium]|nr:formate dehydrogenase accessory sulfurtransferase FdhD [Caulobacteraceae bacterium]